MPGRPQPNQKYFETSLCRVLSSFDPAQPIFVEAESIKIGRLRVPEALIARMWQSPCLRIDMPLTARVTFLTEEYAHFLQDLPELESKLRCLYALHGRETIERWLALASTQRWAELVEQLLVQHYDPAYRRSTLSHFPTLDAAPAFSADAINATALSRLTNDILQS